MEAISSLSRPYLFIRVEGASGAEDVEVAFTAPGMEPAEEDWHPATWVNAGASGADARILIGPGGEVELAKGSHMAWVRVTGAVERPVLASGLVPVT
ncbi:hypothetical protein [Spongiactinospora sp. TRM90649]|uniref:hypothetical protein n=1 Tax=Spongiactinospora sp. TRM90649 TaxID=3031114 RepID=UPI0023F7CEFD|nr:hypothetical protein [Spongiactinospora sp. TRM90649]MDF5756646.1 hypothetical protein [Spongiactinospora sp. TRM90649]